jgi:hypothetical protein
MNVIAVPALEVPVIVAVGFAGPPKSLPRTVPPNVPAPTAANAPGAVQGLDSDHTDPPEAPVVFVTPIWPVVPVSVLVAKVSVPVSAKYPAPDPKLDRFVSAVSEV